MVLFSYVKLSLYQAMGAKMLVKMGRLPYFLYNWLPDVGEIVSLTHQPTFTSRKILDTNFS
jgi:hypothetical protein